MVIISNSSWSYDCWDGISFLHNFLSYNRICNIYMCIHQSLNIDKDFSLQTTVYFKGAPPSVEKLLIHAGRCKRKWLLCMQGGEITTLSQFSHERSTLQIERALIYKMPIIDFLKICMLLWSAFCLKCGKIWGPKWEREGHIPVLWLF